MKMPPNGQNMDKTPSTSNKPKPNKSHKYNNPSTLKATILTIILIGSAIVFTLYAYENIYIPLTKP